MAVIVSLNEKLTFIESVFGKGRLASNSKNFDVRCPIPTCDSRRDRSKTKLSIHVETTGAHCWVCGFTTKNLAPLIKKFGTQQQLLDYCARIQPEAAKFLKTKDANERPPVRLPSDFQLLATATSIHPNVKACRRYLNDRGLSDDDLWYYKFGYSQDTRWARRVIMPSFDAAGTLNYFTGRAVDEHVSMRYDNPDNVVRTELIFNEINVDWTQRLVICEGPFDLVKCGQDAVPILGNRIDERTALFCSIVANGTPVAIALDPQERKKMETLAKKFMEYDVDVLIVDVSPFKDPGEMSKEQFKAALMTARPMSWNDRFMSRLQNASKTSMKVA